MKTLRIVGLAVASLLLFAACDSDSTSLGLHWTRNSGTQTVVYYRIPNWGDSFENPVRAGIKEWSRSSRVSVRLVRTCPPNSHCVPVRKLDLAIGLGGQAPMSWNQDKHLLGARIELDSSLVKHPSLIKDVACHEAGHTLGLMHGPSGGKYGPCINGEPMPHDFRLLLRDYDHINPDSSVPGV